MSMISFNFPLAIIIIIRILIRVNRLFKNILALYMLEVYKFYALRAGPSGWVDKMRSGEARKTARYRKIFMATSRRIIGVII
jgi:hypothetical protein